jgi:hypothetical protein
LQLEIGLSFCVLVSVYLAPRELRPADTDTHPPIPAAGAPPAGPWQILMGVELQARRTSLFGLAISQELVASPSKLDSG